MGHAQDPDFIADLKTSKKIDTQKVLVLLSLDTLEQNKETRHKLRPIAQTKNVSIWEKGANSENSGLIM